MLTDQVMKVH